MFVFNSRLSQFILKLAINSAYSCIFIRRPHPRPPVTDEQILQPSNEQASHSVGPIALHCTAVINCTKSNACRLWRHTVYLITMTAAFFAGCHRCPLTCNGIQRHAIKTDRRGKNHLNSTTVIIVCM